MNEVMTAAFFDELEKISAIDPLKIWKGVKNINMPSLTSGGAMTRALSKDISHPISAMPAGPMARQSFNPAVANPAKDRLQQRFGSATRVPVVGGRSSFSYAT